MTVIIPYGSGLQVFGNSIALGSSAIAGYGYANHLCNWIGGTLDNRAQGNTGSIEITQAGYTYLPYGARQKLVVWDGPLNDIRYYGASAMNAIAPSLNAFLSAAFMGGARPASHTAVTKIGAWSALANTYGGAAFARGATPLQTTDPAAALSFTFTGSRVAVLSYLTETAGTPVYRNLNVSIDGAPSALFELEGKSFPTRHACAAALVFRGLGAGAHTVTVTPSGPGVSVVDSLVFPQPEGFAPVLLGHVPYLQDWTQGGSIATPALIDQANSIISAVAAEWSLDGFPVDVVPINDFYLPSRDHVDGIHPGTPGHRNYGAGYISCTRLGA